MTETNEVTHVAELLSPSNWPAGAVVEENDADKWIWLARKAGGAWIVARDTPYGEWYRKLENTDQIAQQYTFLPHVNAATQETVNWMFRAVTFDLQRRVEVSVQKEMQSDWDELNSELNEYADENSFCEKYEQRINEWNDQFSVMKLVGRKKTYEVELSVTARYSVTVEVEATSEEEASEAAGELDWDDVMGPCDMDSPDDLDWDVDSASIQ